MRRVKPSDSPMTFAALAGEWYARAEQLTPYAAPAAEAFRRAAAELEATLHEVENETVSLSEAAAIGGYSYDHLQALIASGEITNVGRKHRPRIRRRDVPIKPGHPLPSPAEPSHFSARRRIVASVSTKHQETR